MAFDIKDFNFGLKYKQFNTFDIRNLFLITLSVLLIQFKDSIITQSVIQMLINKFLVILK